MNTQQKAPNAANDGAMVELITSFNSASREDLINNTTLTAAFDLLDGLADLTKMVVLDSNITIMTGFDKGTIAQTEGTIGLVMSDNTGAPVTFASVPLVGNQKPLIIDRMQPSAFIIGTLDSSKELIAVDSLEDAVMMAYSMIADNVTILVSIDKMLFNDMVKHFAEAYPVTIFSTLTEKETVCKRLAGHNVKAVIPHVFDVVMQLENCSTYANILADDETTIINLQDEIWGEPERLANDPSKPTPYPIEAFTGLLRHVIEAVARYAQVPLAMAGQCVLGALAHIGQRFIDAPMIYSHKPASLIIIIEGESGCGKSQAMGLTHFKINEHEKQESKIYNKSIKQWKADRKATPPKNLPAFLEANPKPDNPITLFTDATIEPILDMYVSGKLYNASWSTDEAGQFFGGHTMKGDTSSNALSAITKLYSDGEVARLRSGKSAHAIDETNAYDVRFSLMLMGQRVILEPALTDPVMNGQGFLARALIACPEDMRGSRVISNDDDDRYDNPYLIEYWARCGSLLNPYFVNLPRNAGGAESPRIKINWHDKQAKQTYTRLAQAVENRQAKGKALEYLKAYASRMAENASRIASLVAYFEDRHTITTDDITRAFKIVEYSTSERLRYLNATPTGEQNDSEKLSEWLVDKAKGKNPMMLNKSFISQNAPNALRGKKLNDLLDDLQSMGHVRLENDGRKRLVFINPKLIIDV